MKTIILKVEVPDDATIIGIDYERLFDTEGPNEFERLKKHFTPDFTEFIPPTDEEIRIKSRGSYLGELSIKRYYAGAIWFKSLLK